MKIETIKIATLTIAITHRREPLTPNRLNSQRSVCMGVVSLHLLPGE